MQQLNYYSNSEDFLKALSFFQAANNNKQIFNADDVIKPMPSELYVNREITVAGGKKPLLIGSTDNETGVTNFDGNKLEDGRAFVINGIAVNIGIGKKGVKPYNVDYLTEISKEQKIPFQFANVLVKQKDEILVRMPLSSIENGKKDFSGYRDIALSLIAPGSKVEVELEFPDEVETPTLDADKAFYVSVIFRGFESYQKR
ncbi:hypothetical protein [uncultured Tenacibaculum sp.]|uniref:hypothetical protein n=1 Tax=uncultured Tenacibaculum sp. TaxID=174713 RepID=UPI002622A7ED|nr:hypothetical protein [uncultured Tenacibaculum sp.]